MKSWCPSKGVVSNAPLEGLPHGKLILEPGAYLEALDKLNGGVKQDLIVVQGIRELSFRFRTRWNRW